MSFYQKYRPRRFAEVVGQDEITHILRQQLRKGRTHHAYLFAGPSGTGKTSTARILAMALNCESPRAGEPCLKCRACRASLSGNAWDTVELDAATFRGIDGVRDLGYWAKFAPMTNFKMLILDEVQMLTEPAWNALLKLLEEPCGRITIALCTTQPSRVPDTARSRCQSFDFQTIGMKETIIVLDRICRKERLSLAPSALRFVAEMSQGNLRTAESTLEQVMNLNHGKPTAGQVRRFIQAKMMV